MMRERSMAEGMDELSKCHQVEVAVFAGGDQIIGKESARLVSRDAAVFLEPLFLVDALGAETLQELFARFVPMGLFVNTLD